MNNKNLYIKLCLEQINIVNKNINRNRYKSKYIENVNASLKKMQDLIQEKTN